MKEIPIDILSSKTVKNNPQINDLLLKIADLEKQKASLLEKFTTNSKKIQETDNIIDTIKRKIDENHDTMVDTVTYSKNEIYATLQSSLYESQALLESKIAREISLTKQIQQVEQELQQLDKYAAELGALTKRLESSQNAAVQYFARREESRIADSMDVDKINVKVLHFAAVPEAPVFSRLVLLIVGTILGIIMGFSCAVTAEFFDHTLYDAKDVDYYLHLPHLISIPDLRLDLRKLRPV
jgi:uncharacterized protein involved in exopolysaccharide biosynthesis